MARIEGFEALTKQLKGMGDKVGGKALRSAAMTATLPAVNAAKAAAPVGSPPYESGDPYPVRTYKGTLHAPGYLKRNIGRKSIISKDKRFVKVMIGPKPEAFYGTQFIELGTSRISAQPWLEPAFKNARSSIDSRFRKELKKRIDKVAKSGR